jgi:hypothetical protein
MPVIVFDISPGDVVVIRNEEVVIPIKERAVESNIPELGLQVVEPEMKD